MRAGWPAIEEARVDGWIARFSSGVTQRANSVVPKAAPADLDAAIATVQDLYEQRGLPTLFQLTPGTDLDHALAARGYVGGSPTSVHTVDLGTPRAAPGVDIADAPDQDWLDLWWAVDGRGDSDALAVAQKILAGGPALYATVRDEHGAAGVGRLALVDDWGGVYCLAVRPDARRRGLGRLVLDGLLAAGRERGITRSWLQVRAENLGARRLYQRAGYTEVSRYHYRSHRRQEPVQHVHPET